jgi:phosphonate transport system substrate-binding protein
MRKWGLAVMTVFLLFPAVAWSADIKFGLLPRLPEKELVGMFNPLAKYLEKETGSKVTLVIPKDFDTYTQQAIAGDFDIGFTNPFIYVKIRKAVPQTEPLALAAEPGVGTKLKGVFIALKESPLKSFKEAKGKKISFVDQGSAAGYIAQMLELQKAGIKKEDIQISFAGKPPKVGEAVRDGKVDLGGMPESVFKRLNFEYMLKVVGKTEDLPNWALHTTGKTNPATAVKVRDALLKLKPKTAQSDRVLQEANLEGFLAATDKDFDLMRKAAEAAGVY